MAWVCTPRNIAYSFTNKIILHKSFIIGRYKDTTIILKEKGIRSKKCFTLSKHWQRRLATLRRTTNRWSYKTHPSKGPLFFEYLSLFVLISLFLVSYIWWHFFFICHCLSLNDGAFVTPRRSIDYTLTEHSSHPDVTLITVWFAIHQSVKSISLRCKLAFAKV